MDSPNSVWILNALDIKGSETAITFVDQEGRHVTIAREVIDDLVQYVPKGGDPLGLYKTLDHHSRISFAPLGKKQEPVKPKLTLVVNNDN